MGRVNKADRITLSLVAFAATALLSHGDYAAAAACLMLPLLRRALVVVLDVFWTSFTGVPLIHTSERPAGHGLSALLPAILHSGPRPKRGDLFATLAKGSEPAKPTRRLQSTRERLGRRVPENVE
jgi:hypothetical protein